MKKLLILIVIFLYSSIEMFATIDCWIHYRVPPGWGYYLYDGQRRCCTYNGIDCIIIPCDKPPLLGSIEPVQTGGWLIHGTFAGTQLQKKIGNDWINFQREGSNYTFMSSEKLVIDDCTAYPQLNNIQLDLVGITTDSYSNFTIFVPPVQ